jgi:hypothetical protein
MAPSIQEIVTEVSSVNPAKLIAVAKGYTKEEAKQEVTKTEETKKDTPYVKRQIDIEGGTTDAKVRS